ncbi:MAG: RNA polymerase sigma factor RpoD/SigA [Pedobacter sp.]|nr:MAG: RNA polymerase sigma factor RpoD/SigA [Pedobacter sp.]
MRSLIITSSLTLRSFVLERYLQDIGKYDVLSAEEEVALGKRIALGDMAAVEKLVRCNLRFVISVAKKYQNQGLSLEDVIAEGNMGMMVAAKRFDHTKGFKFISFAVWWIRQSIMLAIQQKHRLVRLPGNQHLGVIKIVKAESELEQLLERKPTIGELSEFTELPLQKVKDFQEQTAWSVSLDRESVHDDGGTLLDVLADTTIEAPDRDLMKESLSARVDVLLGRLPQREQEMVRLAYGIGTGTAMDLEEIALRFNLSKERVRQLMRKSVATLQRIANVDILQDLV